MPIRSVRRRALPLVAALSALLLLAACGEASSGTEASTSRASAPAGALACAPDDDGLTLPEGFCAVVVHEGVGGARHLVVEPDGDVHVRLRSPRGGGGLVSLRDTTGDGVADVEVVWGEGGGTGIALDGDVLYYSTDTEVFRTRLPADALAPDGAPERIVSGFPQQRSHAAKSLALDAQGGLYVNVGAPSNACQEQARTPGSPGLDPCPQLEAHGGVWRFSTRPGQQAADGERWATGIRNAVALDWHAASGRLWVAQHGRDQLDGLWPDLFTPEQNAELPAEEVFAATRGDDFGWPYCYYDGQAGRRVLAPEYGGDGTEVGRCAGTVMPVAHFPGHWAPNDLVLADGGGPAGYERGAFVAFHGSWNRHPLPQQGYKVAFVPLGADGATGEHRVFADGFKGADTLASPGDARWRPTGLALGADGSVYIADSVEGRIWRIVPEAQ